MDRSGYRPHRSLLWPILLIGIGLLWLLNSLGTIAAISLPYLFHLWPLLLIFLGLDVLLGRRSHLVGAVLGVVAVVVLVTVAIAGPMIGLERNIQVKTEHFTAPLDGATAASIHLTFSDSPVEIGSLPDPGVLMDARLRYIGLINFKVSGTAKKTVRLSRSEADFLLFNPIYWDPGLNWQIDLAPNIPLDLVVDGGSGESRVDLSGLDISTLKASMGSGPSMFTAPAAGGKPANIVVRGGSGPMSWIIPGDAAVEMELDGGSGSIQIQLPDSPAVQLDVRDSGSGLVNFPGDWIQTASGQRQEGTWVTPNYAQAAQKIHIVITHVGSGGIHIG